MAHELAGPTVGRTKKPTLRTIADMTGFAVTTVSRALADDPRIALDTRKKVSEAARAVGYVPDRAAQRLRTGRTKVITLLLNTNHEFLGFTNEMILGLTQALKGTGYSVTITPDYVEDDRMLAVENILRNRLADGIVFTRTEVFDNRVRFLQENDFPFVSHGRTEFTTPHPFVDFDNEAYARLAVERLASKGRKRIGIILPRERFTFAQHLRYGFLSAVRDLGLDYEIPENIDLDTPAEDMAAYIRERHGRPDAPDGYVCVGEASALSTLAALSDCGIEAGREVDVIAKRASPIFMHFRPQIETVFEDVRATGYDIGTLLLRRIAGEPPEVLQRLHAPQPI